MFGRVLVLVFSVAACSKSHTGVVLPESDGGATPRSDAGAGTVPPSVGDAGSGTRVDAGGPVAVDAGSPGIDVVELAMRCDAACRHISECVPLIDPRACTTDCVDTLPSLAEPRCANLIREVFDCLTALDCAEISSSPDGEPNLERTMCAGVLNRFEDDCAE